MISEKDNVFYCDCGFSWRRGMSGSHRCEDGLRVRLAELAAENHTARNAVQIFCDVVGANTDAICEEVGQDGVKVILAAMGATGNMPATDAFLAEVRAQGVEMFSEKFGGGTLLSDMAKETAKEFAAQLRKGGAA